ncbi:MAG TPA: divalent cation tolerance protein CutA, partial [Planctomycetota bacterium]|nr:divalent cation tolerance protein CutA [Planctomycetota bacterium]
AAAAPALRARLAELHPYRVPEVLELAVSGGLPSYLEWLTASVTPPRG